ncbi:MAG: beta-glucuronidase [Oscillospiraceae bacterium]|nr:beta-glucuronidase [Oscillospiraceae bacterium]
MRSFLSLKGHWQFYADEAQQYTGFPPPRSAFADTIHLPGTTAQAGKGSFGKRREERCLTEKYPFCGNAWFRRLVRIPEKDRGYPMQLFLERTRMTSVWVAGEYVGSQDSLCTPHVYDLTKFSHAPELELLICVCNTGYPTKGGHMTSPDTQTNWNGITGEIRMQFSDHSRILSVRTIPDAARHCVQLRMRTAGTVNMLHIEGEWVTAQGKIGDIMPQMIPVAALESGESSVMLRFGEDVPSWDEYHPIVGQLRLRPYGSDDVTDAVFGLTDFHAKDGHFYSGDRELFLRGKHDAMVFPREGAAPTDVRSWLHVMHLAKTYGINHYRFHTCCPPEAAFQAADLLGIYLEPELPIWGSFHAPDDAAFSPAEQSYLIKEGRRILETFGNHPSFCMFSLGNELWGSRERLGEILRYYKSFEHRILMTQGSNCFQFFPASLPEDDFFSGVRLGTDRLLRGSYGASDVPYGHVQAERPSTMHSYQEAVCPDAETPEKPVISHEIGQYAMFPDPEEAPRYTGVLEAHYFKIIRERLKEAGMLSQAKDFFSCSGKFAVQCYKEELEAAFRTRALSGFQLLDLQDFPGQGIASVGILNAFMDDKGLISPEEWRESCSDSVILGLFPDYCLTDRLQMHIQLRHCSPHSVNEKLHIIVMIGQQVVRKEIIKVSISGQGLFDLGDLDVELPPTDHVHKLEVTMALSYTKKTYRLWQFPVLPETPSLKSTEQLCVTSDLHEAKEQLADGRAVLYLPLSLPESVRGFYCTDFWCYPMFCELAEKNGQEPPPGTLGLLNDKLHPALKDFRCERCTTPPWYDIVTHSELAVLDDLPIQPISQMIDNFTRNHRLGLLFECNVRSGRLLVCTSRLHEILDRPEVRWFTKCLLDYAGSPDFQPEATLQPDELRRVLG